MKFFSQVLSPGKILKHLQTVILCTGLFAVTSLFAASGAHAQVVVPVPQQVFPEDGAHFTHFPRTTTVTWKPVSSAQSYVVEIDCYHCSGADRWSSEVTGNPWFTKTVDGNTTSYSHEFVGDQPGRWRVTAVDAAGNESAPSTWRQFSFETSGYSSGSSTIPNLLGPTDGTVFTNYPRTLTVFWEALKNVDSYIVEFDCLHCSEVSRWSSDVLNNPWFSDEVPSTETSYDFTFVGDQPGRWRVRAVNSNGGMYSPPVVYSPSVWSTFSFDTSSIKPDLTVKDISFDQSHTSIKAHVCNEGDKDVSQFDILFEANGYSNLLTYVPTLSPQSCTDLYSWGTQVFSLAPLVTYDVTVSLDTRHAIDETDETNNSLTKSLLYDGVDYSGNPTPSPSPSASPSPTASPAPSSSPEPTSSPNPTASPEPTASPNPTTSPEPTTSPAPTASPSPSASPSPTASPAPTSSPEPTSSPMPITTPVQVSPPDGTLFTHFPRLTTVTWQSVPNAAEYRVEFDCFHCVQNNEWSSDVLGHAWFSTTVPASQISYSHLFVGDQFGRWRVSAIDAAGNESAASSWWTFNYRTPSGGGPNPTPSASPSPTASPAPSSSPEPTVSPSPTASPAPSSSPEPTSSPNPTASPEPTASPNPTTSPEPTTSPAPTASPSPSASPSPTASPAPSSSPEPTVSPSPTTSPAPTSSPEPTSSPAPTASPTSTPIPTTTPIPTPIPATPGVTRNPGGRVCQEIELVGPPLTLAPGKTEEYFIRIKPLNYRAQFHITADVPGCADVAIGDVQKTIGGTEDVVTQDRLMKIYGHKNCTVTIQAVSPLMSEQETINCRNQISISTPVASPVASAVASPSASPTTTSGGGSGGSVTSTPTPTPSPTTGGGSAGASATSASPSPTPAVSSGGSSGSSIATPTPSATPAPSASPATGGTGISGDGSQGTQSIPVSRKVSALFVRKAQESCQEGDYINSYIRQGQKNDPEDVLKLQLFMNFYMGSNLALTQKYDDATLAVVNAFQDQENGFVLEPWAITEPTGYVYITTRRTINKIVCSSDLSQLRTEEQPQSRQYACTEGQYMTAYIHEGKENNVDQVKKLQAFLNNEMDAGLTVDGEYGDDDIEAVKAFQSREADVVLKPWGITKPTGYVFKTTVQRINALACQ